MNRFPACFSNPRFHLKPKASLVLLLLLSATLLLGSSGCIKSMKKGLGSPESSASKIQWHEHFEEALSESAATGKPILADFTGTDWCVWCTRLKDEVFEKDKFIAWAQENVVLLELDYPRRNNQTEQIKAQNEELAKRFNVESYPTIVFISPSGEEIGRTGYVKGGPEKWSSVAEAILNPAGPQQ